MVNVSNFKEFVEKINRDINEKYDNFSFIFAKERKELSNLSKLVSPKQLISLIQNHINENYDFNYGGQKEVQYHIYKNKNDYIDYGLGFSFETSRSNPNPFNTVKPFTDVFLDKDFNIYLNQLINKGYNFIRCNVDNFYKPVLGKYYLFGKSIRINNNEISDEDYENMLNNFANDLFNLYKKIFTMRKEFMDNKKMPIDNNNDLLHKCQELLENNYNLILTGAPGTGKTYLAKQIAASIILEKEINSYNELNSEEKANIKNQMGFVQFHPSYDYTDFVEGIKPTKDKLFERQDGIFKEFCKKALDEISYQSLDEDEDVDEIQDISEYDKNLVAYLKQYIDALKDECKNNPVELKGFVGKNISPLVDAGYNDKKIFFTIQNSKTGKKSNKEARIDFFIGAYKRFIENDVFSYTQDSFVKQIKFWWSPASFYGFVLKFYEKYNDELKKIKGGDYKEKKYVFIIDEINRGDLNKILGELFYALDPGYRGHEGMVKTQYSSLINAVDDPFKHGFYIPENVYIIGTMNDIDRSVESMDFAIRRRFAWQEVKPEDTADEILKNVKIDSAASVLNDFNKMIADKDALGEMYQIGASYFLKLNNYINDDKINDQESIKEAYQKLWDNHLKGLIHEYVRGKKSGEEIFDKIKNKYFDLTGINCKENNEDTAE